MKTRNMFAHNSRDNMYSTNARGPKNNCDIDMLESLNSKYHIHGGYSNHMNE